MTKHRGNECLLFFHCLHDTGVPYFCSMVLTIVTITSFTFILKPVRLLLETLLVSGIMHNE